MTSVASSNKASIVLACALTLTAVTGATAPLEGQTLSRINREGGDDDVVSLHEGAEIVLEPEIFEQQKAEKAERLAQKFKQLAGRWHDERGSMSSITEMSMLPSYQGIIGMGPAAVPLILAQLRGEGDDPDQWFWALISISRANDLDPPQIAPQDQGNFRIMAKAWIEWGEAQGYAG